MISDCGMLMQKEYITAMIKWWLTRIVPYKGYMDEVDEKRYSNKHEKEIEWPSQNILAFIHPSRSLL